MANVKRNRERKKYQMWTKLDIEKFGNNAYGNAIIKILQKDKEVGREKVDGSTTNYKKLIEVVFEDNRDGVRFFPHAHWYIRRLSPMGISLLFYLSRNAFENINIVVLKDKEACYRFCGIDQKVEENMREEMGITNVKIEANNNFLSKEPKAVKTRKIKHFEDFDKEKQTRMARMLRNAVNDLIDNECIVKTKVSGHFWMNPYILIKGSLEKVPMEFNNYNLGVLDEREKDKHWRFNGFDIRKEDSQFVVFFRTEYMFFDSLQLAVDYITDAYN